MKISLRRAVFASLFLLLLIHVATPHLDFPGSGVWPKFNNKVIIWGKYTYFYFDTYYDFWKLTKGSLHWPVASTKVEPLESIPILKSHMDFYVWHLEVYYVSFSGFNSSLIHKLHLLNAKLTFPKFIRTSREIKGCRLFLVCSTWFIQMFALSMTIGHFLFHKIWKM